MVISTFALVVIWVLSESVRLKLGNLSASKVTSTVFIPVALSVVTAFFTAADKSAPDKTSSFSLNVTLSVGRVIISPVYW